MMLKMRYYRGRYCSHHMNYTIETVVATAALSSSQCAAPQRFQKIKRKSRASPEGQLLLTGKNRNLILAYKVKTLGQHNLAMAATQIVLGYLRNSLSTKK